MSPVKRRATEVTALDRAMHWGDLLKDGIFNSSSALARSLQVELATVTRMLAVLRVPQTVLNEIRSAAPRFTNAHLHAIARVWAELGEQAALDMARSVARASPDAPVSARQIAQTARDQARHRTDWRCGRKPAAPAITVTDASGERLGVLRGFNSGRLDFTPCRGVPGDFVERVAEAIRAVLLQSDSGDAHTTSQAAPTQDGSTRRGVPGSVALGPPLR